MARCGCFGGCSCILLAGDGVTVTGAGSPDNPYIIEAEGGGGGEGFRAGAGSDSVIGGDLDFPATAAGDSALAIGNGSDATGFSSVAVGHADALEEYAVALGNNGTVSSGYQSIAVGSNVVASGSRSTAIGQGAIAAGPSAVAIGRSASAPAEDSVAIGNSANADFAGAVAIGPLTEGGADGAVAIGNGSVVGALGTNATAIGGGVANADGAIAIGPTAASATPNLAVLGAEALEISPPDGVTPTTLVLWDSSPAPHTYGATSTGPTYDGAPIGVVEQTDTVAATGAAETVSDVDVATTHFYTLDANCTFTFPAHALGKSFTIVVTAGGFSATWPGTVLWPGGVAPTLTATAGKRDVLTFVAAPGPNWLGFVAGQNY